MICTLLAQHHNNFNMGKWITLCSSELIFYVMQILSIYKTVVHCQPNSSFHIFLFQYLSTIDNNILTVSS